ncbi:MAG TPA: ATP-binding cassette domain-containing protein, partial [Candidatus Saccharimonadales bacterium]|nr:ATP-binding cassette domain-containing protein [Candidatus Saccharimonadales bacterium]
ALGEATTMTTIINTEIDVCDPAEPQKFSITKGRVVFDNVSFAHPDDKKDVLFTKLNLDIKAGQKIGLVGHSGSGKTTLTKLLLRFMDTDTGSITIDGHNIRDIAQTDLRSSIAYVPQEPLLFHRTLAENIAYAKPDASLEEIRSAADKANALEFIERLPHGFDTVVGERGIKLSGGQRQRIAIARAILKDAPVLILDEATSALDSESEKSIQQALSQLMKGRTAIVIAHRLSTIRKLDRIIVMETGMIREDGDHQQLIDQGGIYAHLWHHQSGGLIEQ